MNSPKSKRRDGAGSDEDWFQEQLAAERKERQSAKRKDSTKKDAQKKGGGSLWDWTGLNDVVHAVGKQGPIAVDRQDDHQWVTP